LLFEMCQPQPLVHARGGKGGRFPFQVPEQSCAKHGGAIRFASLQRARTLHHVLRGSFFRQVTVNSRADALEKFRFLSRHTNQENLHLGSGRAYPSDRTQILVSVPTRREQEDVRFFFEQVVCLEWLSQVSSDYFNLAALEQHPRKRLPQQAILGGHEDARLVSHGGAAVGACLDSSHRRIRPPTAIRMDSSLGLLCQLQNLTRSCVHSGTSSMSFDSHALCQPSRSAISRSPTRSPH
jgi:hypothetical protein